MDKVREVLHIMRDHPVHAELIMGGLWGGKAGLLSNIVEVINKFHPVKNKKSLWIKYFLLNLYGL